MIKLLREFLRFKRFVREIREFRELKKSDVEDARSYRNERIEEHLYDSCKRRMFKDFADGSVSREYIHGYLSALSVHRAITAKRQSE